MQPSGESHRSKWLSARIYA